MPYASTSNIEDSYGAGRLDMLSADDAGVRDAAKIARALDDASALIDGYISQRYPLPLTTVPAVLREACVSIAVYKLATDPTALTEDMRARYDDALRFLRDVATSKAALGIPTLADGASAAAVEAASPQVAIIESAPREFTRAKLRRI